MLFSKNFEPNIESFNYTYDDDVWWRISIGVNAIKTFFEYDVVSMTKRYTTIWTFNIDKEVLRYIRVREGHTISGYVSHYSSMYNRTAPARV